MNKIMGASGVELERAFSKTQEKCKKIPTYFVVARNVRYVTNACDTRNVTRLHNALVATR